MVAVNVRFSMGLSQGGERQSEREKGETAKSSGTHGYGGILRDYLNSEVN